MPFDDPEPSDPHWLVGVVLPGDETATREMAAAFADEFAQLGFDRRRIMALYRNPFYKGAHGALQALGEEEIGRIVDESLRVWGQYRFVVQDKDDDSPAGRGTRESGLGSGDSGLGEEDGRPGKLVGLNGFLRVLR